MRSTTGQIRGNDLASVRINRKVQLPPGPVLRWLPQIADVNPETRTVDEQVDGSIVRNRTKRANTLAQERPRRLQAARLSLNRSAPLDFAVPW